MSNRQAAIRRALRRAKVDIRLAQLVLLFPGERMLRVADVAWFLGVSSNTASRLLDRAEAMALVDKFRPITDRRGIDVRLTAKGHRLQREVRHMVRTTEFEYRDRGYAYGLRWYLEVCDDKEFPED